MPLNLTRYFSWVYTLAILFGVSDSTSQAQTYYWDTTPAADGFGTAGGTWGTDPNWSTSSTGSSAVLPALVVTATTDSVNFGSDTDGLLSGIIAVNGTVNVGSITFGSASGAITLSGGTAINFAAAGTITVDNASNTIGTAITGAATSLTKAGSGTLILTAANTYTGTTAITAGTLQLGNGGATGSLYSPTVTTGNLTFGSAATITNNGALVYNIAGGALNVNRTITGTGTVSVTGNQQVNFAAGTSISTAGSQTYSATATSGRYNGFNLADNATVTLTSTAGNISMTGMLGTANASTGNLNLNTSAGNGNVTLNVAVGVANVDYGLNSLTVTAGTGTITLGNYNGVGWSTPNTMSLTGGAVNSTAAMTGFTTLTVTNSSSSLFSGTLSGGGSLTKAGAGTLTLSNANTFSGTTTVNAGTLALTNSLALQNSSLTTAGVVFDSSVVSNAFTLGGLSGLANLTLANNAGVPAAIALSVGNNNAALTHTGALSGTGSLIKVGTGTQTLGGANTYTGVTRVTAGTLQFSKTSALYNGAAANWTAANIKVPAGGTFAINVGGFGEFTAGNITTLLANLGGANGTSTTGFAAGAFFGFDTTNASGGTYTVPNVIADSTGTGGGALGVAKLGNGALTLNNANTFSAGARLIAGTLNINSTAALGTGAFQITGAATIDNTSGGAIAVANVANIAGLNVTFGGTNPLTFTNGINLLSGTTSTITVNSGSDLTIGGIQNNIALTNVAVSNGGSPGFGGQAFTKAGIGTLTINGPSRFGGGKTINLTGGTLNLNNNGALQSFNGNGANTLNISAGTTLDNTSGGLITIAAGTSGLGTVNVQGDFTFGGTNALTMNSAVVLNANRQLMVNGSAVVTLTGLVTGNTFTLTKAGGGNLTLSGSVATTSGGVTVTGGTLTLGGANTYTGNTLVIAGTLNLTGSPTGVSPTLVNGGTLNLDYTTNTGKIADTAALTLGGGTLTLTGGSHTEVVASTTIASGSSSVTRASGSTVLRMNSIVRNAGGAVNFATASIADTTTLNDPSTGILGPWATVGGDWAVNSTNAANGPITAYTGYTDVTRLDSGPQVIIDGSATNVRIIEGTGSPANLTLGMTTTTINTLNQSTQGGNGAATIDLASIQTLAVGGVLVGSGAGPLTIGTAVGTGTLSAATAGGELILNAQPGTTLTVNTVIADNTSASSLTKAGGGTLTLAVANSYTGGTTVGGGVLSFVSGALGTAGTVTVNGGTLQWNGSNTQDVSARIALVAGGSATFDTNGNNVTFAAAIGGGTSSSLTKAGGGTLTLSAANTYTGPTTVAGGTLLLSGAANNNNSDIALAGGANLTFTDTTTSRSFTKLLTGTGTNVTFNVVGNLTATGGGNGSNFTLSNNGNTFIGTVVINTGLVSPASDAVFGNAANVIQIAGGGLVATGNLALPSSRSIQLSGTGDRVLRQYGGATMTVNGVISGSGNLFKTDGGTLLLTGNNTYNGTTTIGNGTLQVGNGGTSGTLGAGNVTITAGTLVVNRTDAFTIAGLVSGAGGVTQSGTGTTTLTNPGNTYTGTTTVTAGRLIQNYGATATTNSAAYAISGGATFEVNVSTSSHNMNTNSTLSGAGTFVKSGGGTLVWGGSAAAFNFSAGALIDIQGGQLTGGSSANEVWTNNLSGLNVASGATFDGVEANVIVDALTGSGTIKSGYAGAGYSVFTFGRNGGSGTFNGVLADTTGFVGNYAKAGSGTQTLTGNNTYTGTTAVNGGTLLANNTTAGQSSTGSGTVTVNGGASAAAAGTLGGNGRVAGAVIVNGTGVVPGTITAGTGTGATILTLGSTLSVADGARYRVAIFSDATNDASRLAVTGNVSLGSTVGAFVTLDLSAVTPAALAAAFPTGTSYTIATSGGNLANNGSNGLTIDYANSTMGTFDITNSAFTLTTTSSSVVLNYSPVPEPATVLGLSALGLGLAGWVRRRKDSYFQSFNG